MAKASKTEKAILELLSDLSERLQTFEESVSKNFKKTDQRLNSVYDRVMSDDTSGGASNGKKPKRAKKERSASEPRKPPTAYILWKNEQQPKLKEKYEDVEDKEERNQKISEALSEGWKDEKIKAKYNKKYQKLKEEHVKSLAAYKAKKAGEASETGDSDGDNEEEEEVVVPPKKEKKTPAKASTSKKEKKKAAPPPEDSDDSDSSDSSDAEVVKKLRGKGKTAAPNDKELEDLLNDSDDED